GAAATTYAGCSSTILEQGSASVSGRNSAPSLVSLIPMGGQTVVSGSRKCHGCVY
ncbi:unnamed protein product, partial [Staurois parvus]